MIIQFDTIFLDCVILVASSNPVPWQVSHNEIITECAVHFSAQYTEQITLVHSLYVTCQLGLILDKAGCKLLSILWMSVPM